MKTVLGLIGSPRRRGNCEWVVRTVSRSVAEPRQLKPLRGMKTACQEKKAALKAAGAAFGADGVRWVRPAAKSADSRSPGDS